MTSFQGDFLALVLYYFHHYYLKLNWELIPANHLPEVTIYCIISQNSYLINPSHSVYANPFFPALPLDIIS